MFHARSKVALLIFVAMMGCSITTSAFAATYYLDATNGSDSYAGTGASTAWKTVAKVNSSTFSPGDQILFKRGETWREMLVVPSSGNASSAIAIGAYGTGANPVISGSDLIASAWTKDSASHIWKASVAKQPNILYFNGSRGIPVTAKTGIDAELKWYWASGTLYVWSPSDTSSPDSYYTTPGIEAGSRDAALKTNDKSYLTVDGLTLRDGNRTKYTTVVTGWNSAAGITFQNCVIERGAGSGIYLSAATTATSFTIKNCTVQNNGGWGILADTLFSSGTISNNVITGNGWRSIDDAQQYDGVAGKLGNVNIFANVIYANSTVACAITMGCHGIYNTTADAATVNIYDNTIFGQTNGGAIKNRSSANIFRNVLYGNYGPGVNTGENGTANVAVKIYNNSIYNNNASNAFAGILEDGKGTGALQLSITNNTLYNNANTAQHEIKLVDDVTSLTLKNNVIYASPTRRTISAPTQTGTVAIDNNLHWRADGNPAIIYNDKELTWAQWQSFGFDRSGVNRDPLLVSLSKPDFRLQPASPCIDAGADLGLPADINGLKVPHGNAPDIGAFEWYPLPSPPSLQVTL